MIRIKFATPQERDDAYPKYIGWYKSGKRSLSVHSKKAETLVEVINAMASGGHNPTRVRFMDER